MARNHLTLAALATAAVPGIKIVSSVSVPSADKSYDTALLADVAGKHWTIKVPRTASAETRLAAEQLALNAISKGVRERLPFDLPFSAGQIPFESTKAVVSSYVYGRAFSVNQLLDSPKLAQDLGEAIAAIHSIPSAVISNSGLVQQSSIDSRRQTVEIIEQAIATSLIPNELENRWQEVAGKAEVWQFEPTVVHGSLQVDSLLAVDDSLSGILDWNELKLSDPAADFAWLYSIDDPELSARVFESYSKALRVKLDESFKKRAKLYDELSIARWLLHGTALKDQNIIDDALEMVSALLERSRSEFEN